MKLHKRGCTEACTLSFSTLYIYLITRMFPINSTGLKWFQFPIITIQQPSALVRNGIVQQFTAAISKIYTAPIEQNDHNTSAEV